MKHFNLNTFKYVRDAKVQPYTEAEPLMSSEEFLDKYKGFIDDIALRKTIGTRKHTRSLEYSAIGIMTRNDLLQEGYLAFFEAYENLNWDKINEAPEQERGAVMWGYLKRSTNLNYEKSLRAKKDGVKTPERVYFESDSVNTNFITKLFSQMEKTFANNVEEVGLTKWETDLIGMFLDVHLDEFLDLTREGNRDFKKQERLIIKSLYGIDSPIYTYAELSEKLKIPQGTIRQVKSRAIQKLQDDESKKLIANFLYEYRITTQADTDQYRD